MPERIAERPVRIPHTNSEAVLRLANVTAKIQSVIFAARCGGSGLRRPARSPHADIRICESSGTDHKDEFCIAGFGGQLITSPGMNRFFKVCDSRAVFAANAGIRTVVSTGPYGVSTDTNCATVKIFPEGPSVSAPKSACTGKVQSAPQPFRTHSSAVFAPFLLRAGSSIFADSTPDHLWQQTVPERSAQQLDRSLDIGLPHPYSPDVRKQKYARASNISTKFLATSQTHDFSARHCKRTSARELQETRSFDSAIFTRRRRVKTERIAAVPIIPAPVPSTLRSVPTKRPAVS